MMPSTTIQHLDFVIDSINMTVSLPSDKLTRLVRSCQDLLVTDRVSIRKLAQVIGTIVSSFMAVVHGQLHYRGLEMFKTQCLDQTHSYDRLVTLSNPCRADLLWWCDNAVSANGRSISDILGFSNCSDDLFTDASKSGWGTVLIRSGKVLDQCVQAIGRKKRLNSTSIFLSLQLLGLP